MRTESAAYRAARLQWVTQPRLFIRCSYVRQAGDVTEYPHSVDYSTGPVVSAATTKVPLIKMVSGAAQQADPIAGRSSIGSFDAQLADNQTRMIARAVADPARPLAVAIDSDDTAITVDRIVGYPDQGHLIIENEDCKYTGRDLGTKTFTGVVRAQRGTTAAAHAIGALVRNGEQLRRGTRVTLYLGYAPMPEADYGPAVGYIKMEVQSVASVDFNQTWVLRCSDLQRFAKRRIFEAATVVNPVQLGPDHPITLFLRVWMSGKGGANGPYDVLPSSVGAGVPYQLVDIETWEALRSLPDIRDASFEFREIEPQDAKEWAETQILRPLGILPYVNPAGQYSGRMIPSPPSMTAAAARFGYAVA
jgi:hypothetical protein